MVSGNIGDGFWLKI